MLKSKQNVLNKAGIFNEDLSDSTNMIASSSVSSLSRLAECNFTMKFHVFQNNTIEKYFHTNDMSQSSLDEIIANICTGDADHRTSTVNASKSESLPEKENINQNDLLGFLDGNEEDFIGLEY